uniref:Uncharacterized protein n=1 Tax=Physcomitrium patens TaxID=3218 RepID=A0A2K1KT60_PHYPA|nr:hypothetical protein PHYPA_003977 [Physcomitrium patens]
MLKCTVVQSQIVPGIRFSSELQLAKKISSESLVTGINFEPSCCSTLALEDEIVVKADAFAEIERENAVNDAALVRAQFQSWVQPATRDAHTRCC